MPPPVSVSFVAAINRRATDRRQAFCPLSGLTRPTASRATNVTTAPPDITAVGFFHGGIVDAMLSGRQGLSSTMVGRAAALARLTGLVEAVEVASCDGPELVLVSGEAGIGKTRLLREFIARLPNSVTTIVAAAQPGSLGRAFDVVSQLCPPGGDPAHDVAPAMAAAVAAGPVVLVIEDLHWIDADSAHVLEHLAQQPLQRLVIVGTYRPNDLSRKAPGGELIGRLERQHSVEQVRLDRLDRGDVATMLGAIDGVLPSSAAVDAVFRRSGGVPFVIEELIRCCGYGACSEDLLTVQLPWSLDEAVRQQLAEMPVAQRHVIDALAVFGGSVSFEMISAISGMDEADLLVAMRELVGLSIVVEVSDDLFWFTHALTADSVYQQLLGRDRRRLHERALAALRSQPGADHASLARHAQGAGAFEQVAGIAREGAPRYLARGASFQALRLASDGLAEAPDDPQLLGVATDAAWRLQFATEAMAYAHRWRSAAATDVDRVEAMRFIARLYHEQSDDTQRDAALEALIEFSATLPSGPALGRSMGAVAQLMMLTERLDEAIEWADRSLAEARRNGDEWLIVQALVERSSSRHLGETNREVEQALIEARNAARAIGDGVLECRALNNLLTVVSPHSVVGEWARAELAEAAKVHGIDRLGAVMLTLWEAEAALASGDIRRLRVKVAEAAEHWPAGTKEHGFYLSLFSDLLIEEGRVVEALAVVSEMLESELKHCHDTPGPQRVQIVAGMLTSDPQLVERGFTDVLDIPLRSSMASVPWLVTDIVLCALAGGIAPARIRDEVFGGWLANVSQRDELWTMSAGLVSHAEGDNVAAVAALEAFLDSPDPRLYAPLIGSMRLVLASARLATGDRRGAIEAAEHAAHVDLASWPGWRRDRAEALLRRLEGRIGRVDGELTPREREVASLIAEGLTNGQLAERLYISPKTAAVHVSNILMKLGLGGRAEVAAWAVRQGIDAKSA
jgi:DNA-binding CsgD family transcriptional regulator